MAALNPIGMKFGRLTVVGLLPNKKRKRAVEAKCDCGNVKDYFLGALLRGHTKSCGCFQRQRVSETFRTHGATETRLYRIWCVMLTRCTNAKSQDYPYYGGRGITICDRWINSFEAFKEDMGEPTTEKHTIDRKDSNGNYEPSNCRWATRKEQMRNMRRNRVVEFEGRRKTVAEWAEITGIAYSTMIRLIKRGMDVGEVIARQRERAKLIGQ